MDSALYFVLIVLHKLVDVKGAFNVYNWHTYFTKKQLNEIKLMYLFNLNESYLFCFVFN